MLFVSLDVEEQLPSQEGRRAASPRVVNRVEEVDYVTHIREDRRLVVFTFWSQLRIAHRSLLRGWKRSTLVVGLTPAAVLTQSKILVDSCSFHCQRQCLVLSSDFGRVWL